MRAAFFRHTCEGRERTERVAARFLDVFDKENAAPYNGY